MMSRMKMSFHHTGTYMREGVLCTYESGYDADAAVALHVVSTPWSQPVYDIADDRCCCLQSEESPRGQCAVYPASGHHRMEMAASTLEQVLMRQQQVIRLEKGA